MTPTFCNTPRLGTHHALALLGGTSVTHNGTLCVRGFVIKKNSAQISTHDTSYLTRLHRLLERNQKTTTQVLRAFLVSQDTNKCVRASVCNTDKSGSYCFNFNTSDLPPGDYIVRIHSDNAPLDKSNIRLFKCKKNPILGEVHACILPHNRQKTLRIGFFDLDQTLIQTPLESLWGKVKSVLRTADEIKPVPGMLPIANAYASQERSMTSVVSSSPETLRPNIQSFFDNHQIPMRGGILLKNLTDSRFALHDHFSHKLFCLCEHVEKLPPKSVVSCLGDSIADDALVYTHFYKALSNRFDPASFRELCLLKHIPQDVAQDLSQRLSKLSELHITPRSILIRMVNKTTQQSDIKKINPDIVCVQDALQASLILVQRGELALPALNNTLLDLKKTWGDDFEKNLEASLDDARDRLHVENSLLNYTHRFLVNHRM